MRQLLFFVVINRSPLVVGLGVSLCGVRSAGRGSGLIGGFGVDSRWVFARRFLRGRFLPSSFFLSCGFLCHRFLGCGFLGCGFLGCGFLRRRFLA